MANGSLAEMHPDLVKEWHPTKNGDLKPDDITAGSGKKVWWYLPYDDPKTGKHFVFEWEDYIYNRAKSYGCPYISGHRVWPGFNDLETRDPEIAKQWHSTRNGELTAKDVAYKSNKLVWWEETFQDEKTGKVFNFEWQAKINNRVIQRENPFISGKRVWKGYNDLRTTNPDLVKEWHPTKNGGLTPLEVTSGSSKKVWWLLPYDDPETSKHFDFEWEATINSRVRGNGCPYLANQKLYTGFNDLASRYPNIVDEWDYEKNYPLVPSDVMYGSNRKVWWKKEIYDEIKGTVCAVSWADRIIERSNGKGCPYEARFNSKVLKGYNDFISEHPYLLEEWDFSKNGGQSPYNYSSGSAEKVWWNCPVCGNVYRSEIRFRCNGGGCPKCNKETQVSFAEATIFYYLSQIFTDAIWSFREFGFELDIYIPSIRVAIEYDGYYWHKDSIEKDKTKNNKCSELGITLYRFREALPSLSSSSIDILLNSENKTELAEELHKLISELSKEHIEINISEDRSKIYSLYIKSQKSKSLKIIYPELAKEWHPTRNGNITPEMVSTSSGKKVWWLLPYDDSKTGKHFDFEWEDTVSHRSNGRGCPYLVGKDVWKGYNDLQSICPDLASEWDYKKNKGLTPEEITFGSNQNVWWISKYEDPNTHKLFVFEWEASPHNRVKNPGNPFLSGQRVWVGYNDLETVNPELAKEWHPTKNGKKTPKDFTKSSGYKAWWLLHYDDPITGKHFEFEWEASINHRSNGRGCPYIANQKLYKGFNDLATRCPDIAAQWNYKKNARTPEEFVTGSNEKVWWLLPYDDPITGKHFDFEWESTINSRIGGSGCPYLVGQAVWPGYNDLETLEPELSKEWAYDLNYSLTPKDVTKGSGKIVYWRCSLGHEWQASISNRVSGRGCPICKNKKIIKR